MRHLEPCDLRRHSVRHLLTSKDRSQRLAGAALESRPPHRPGRFDTVRHPNGGLKNRARPKTTAYSSRRSLVGCILLVAGRSTLLHLPLALGAPLDRGSDIGADEGTARLSSLDFAVSGANNRLEGLMVGSRTTAGSESEMPEGKGEKGTAGKNGSPGDDGASFVVVDGPTLDTTGVFPGDRLLAVNGIPLPSMPLREWIETSAAGIPAGGQPASTSSAGSAERIAIFPLVDIDIDPLTGGGDRTLGIQQHSSSSGANSDFSTDGIASRQCTLGAHDPTCSSSASVSPSAAPGTEVKTQENLPGFPLKGFLKIELVMLDDVEVAFRPGQARRAALIEEGEEAAAMEKKERDRAIAEAQALLETARREKEEEAKKAEASAKAKEAERAREQAEVDRKAEEKRQEEARIRREEEAAKKAAEKSKKDVAKLRKEGKQFTFTAEYKEVAPMGLTFDLANPFAVVSEVTPGGLSHRAGVKVGDHLVRVNDRDTGDKKPAATLKVLQRAVWPRVLTFSAPESLGVQGGDEPLLLGLAVTDPEIVRGEYVMQAPKDWGRFRTVGVDKNKEEVKGVAQNLWSCDPHPMALVDPPPACQRNLRLLGGAGEDDRRGEPVIALVKRGVCTFVEKAKNVQLAIFNKAATADASTAMKRTTAIPTTRKPRITATGDGGISITTAAGSPPAAAAAGRGGDAQEEVGIDGGVRGVVATKHIVGGGMVLLNGEDALADMPAGNLLTDDVGIPVAMISRGNGSSVEELLSWGVEVRATISPLGGCPLPPLAPDSPESAKPRKDDDDGGRFLVLSKTVGGAEFDYRLARYGAGIGEGETSPVAIAVADPVDGCEDKAYKFRVAGMFVAVERGGCSFSMKTLAAQRAGALGVIIVNTAEVTLRVMADQGDGDKAVIPTVMISASAGRFLSIAAGDSSRSPILGRFTRESFDAGRG